MMSEQEQTATPAAPARSPNEPIIIKLRKPFQFGSRNVDKITVRPVKGKDMRKLRGNEPSMTQTLMLASQLTGELDEIIDELQGQDLGELFEAVNFFLLGIQPTGGT